MTKHTEPNPTPDWTSPATRICWLVEKRFGGNRSKFAEAVGFSHTLIFKVIGGQPPGRRLCEAIAQRLNVNLAWLIAGEGQPGQPGTGPGTKIPVAHQPLAGSPQGFPDLLIDDSPAIQPVFSSSQYWLRLMADQPIVRELKSFRAGDYLLFETDAASFPRGDRLYQYLCICRVGADQGIKLGTVTHHAACEDTGPAHFTVETFDLRPYVGETVQEVVYHHYPDGVIRMSERRLKLAKPGKARAAPVHSEPIHPRIKYRDIVAVWTGTMHRFPSLP